MKIRTMLTWGIGCLAIFSSQSAAIAATPDTYDISVLLPPGSAVTSFQVAMDYGSVPGRFVGERGAVQCRGNKSLDAVFAFFQCDPKESTACVSDRQVNAALASIKPIVGPVELFSCTFESAGQVPDGNGFKVDVVDSAVVENGRVVPEFVRAFAQVRVSK